MFCFQLYGNTLGTAFLYFNVIVLQCTYQGLKRSFDKFGVEELESPDIIPIEHLTQKSCGKLPRRMEAVKAAKKAQQ